MKLLNGTRQTTRPENIALRLGGPWARKFERLAVLAGGIAALNGNRGIKRRFARGAKVFWWKKPQLAESKSQTGLFWVTGYL